MIKRILIVVCLLASITAIGQSVSLTTGMKIDKSAKVTKAVYNLRPSADMNEAAIVIEGNDIVIDFSNATINGSDNPSRPDEFTGVAILIRNSNGVTIKNLNAKGFKVALMARNVSNLVIENCDFSYNYRQRLNSTQEKEDVSDWMSYHQNEKDEWLRYGAAIYLRDCNSVVVRNNRVTGGQNALMMTSCNNGMIYGNDFSFNSGIGIGMYRSSRNKVMNNRVIFNVRGYSHGVYNRGQDSAGILVYEQSNENFFYKNNVTHGGDGFFLWAGQSTMETGKGGCNDNILLGNDFSYAPTNGIEVTFSRNLIFNNRIFGCDHGIWGGYSYDTRIANNQFRNNRIGIAIEHGQHNDIYNNLFAGDKEAIRLWSRSTQPDNWGYAKERDTRSAGYSFIGNSFNNHQVVFNLAGTDSINIFDNTVSARTEKSYRIDSSVTNLDTFFLQSVYDRVIGGDLDFLPPGYEGKKDPFEGSGRFAGRSKILITEWGPYDYQYPIAWLTNPVSESDSLFFDVLGPEGNWKVKSSRGLRTVSSKSGKIPGKIVALRERGERTDIELELEFTGSVFTDQFGRMQKKGKFHTFRFRKFFQPMNWEVVFYSLDTAYHDPIATGELLPRNVRMAPFKIDTVDRLEYAWWGGIQAGETRHRQFVTFAAAKVELPPAKYELSLTWDDAIRLYIDDSLVVNEWEPSKYDFDQSPNKKLIVQLGGTHHFRVEHVELGGFATLNLRLRPMVEEKK